MVVHSSYVCIMELHDSLLTCTYAYLWGSISEELSSSIITFPNDGNMAGGLTKSQAYQTLHFGLPQASTGDNLNLANYLSFRDSYTASLFSLVLEIT